MDENVLELRELILNARYPIVFRKFKTNWPCCKETLEDWCNHFDETGKKIEFEQMPKQSSTGQPQWERERKKVELTMNEFLKEHKSSEHLWTALNYKTPDEIPDNCKVGIDFSCFGFPNLTNDYARFWLSTENANTPCHQDTYGCNIVVQAFGRKLWLLFPPNAPLTTTRLPYEESSVYCMENFYAPSPTQETELARLQNDAYLCDLEAGDVLVVPRFWWHFVETKEVSLSINVWIPLDVDHQAQLKECVVKFIIETIARGEKAEAAEYLLNPNQRELCSETDTFSILAYLAEQSKSDEYEGDNKKTDISYPYQYNIDEEKFQLLLLKFKNASFVEKADAATYKKMLSNNAKRYIQNNGECKDSPIKAIKENLINSLCCSAVVDEIVKEFQKRL